MLSSLCSSRSLIANRVACRNFTTASSQFRQRALSSRAAAAVYESDDEDQDALFTKNDDISRAKVAQQDEKRQITTKAMTTKNPVSWQSRTREPPVERKGEVEPKVDSSLENSIVEKLNATEKPKSRLKPMGIKERILFFNTGVKLLWNDWLLYQNIKAASETRRNAWNNPKLAEFYMASHNHNSLLFIDGISSAAAIVPRRQRNFQAQLARDLSKVFPVVFVAAIPVIGYVPIVMSVLAPRLLLTRHFWNEYEQRDYALQSYQNRVLDHHDFQEYFVETMETYGLYEHLSAQEEDVGKLTKAYSLFCGVHGNEKNQKLPFLSDVSLYPRDYLEKYALAVGILPSIPPSARKWIVKATPSILLQNFIRKRAVEICLDDTAILSEHQRQSFRKNEDDAMTSATSTPIDYCASFTDMEIVEACVMRCLPVFNLNENHEESMETMRRFLSNYLHLVRQIQCELSSKTVAKEVSSDIAPSPETFGLFAQHLSILRHGAKRAS